MIIVAHRGASGYAPENTLPAFRLAWAQGADAIEGDFHLTKDGHIVCIHNKDTSAVAGRYLAVGDSTLEALRELDVGASHGPEHRGSIIPIFPEVLATVPSHKQIYIEIKCGIAIVPALLKKVQESGLTKQQIVFISFDPTVIQTLKTKAPQYKAFWLCYFSPRDTEDITTSITEVLKTLARIRADGLSSNPGISELLIKEIQKHGYEWHVWTIDDPAIARKMKALGAKSITTNMPDLMRKCVQ